MKGGAGTQGVRPFAPLLGVLALSLGLLSLMGCPLLMLNRLAQKITEPPKPSPSATPTLVAMPVPQAPTEPRPEVPHRTVARIVASVDGEPITAHDIEQFTAAVGRPVKTDNIASNEEAKAALKALISQKLLEKEIQQYSSKIEEDQVDKYVDMVQHDKKLTPEQFKAALAQSGMSMDDFRKHAREELEKEMMIRQQVRQRVDVTPEEIQAYYDSHKEDFTVTTERLKVAQILIGVPQNANPQQIALLQSKADRIRKEAAAGADLAISRANTRTTRPRIMVANSDGSGRRI